MYAPWVKKARPVGRRLQRSGCPGSHPPAARPPRHNHSQEYSPSPPSPPPATTATLPTAPSEARQEPPSRSEECVGRGQEVSFSYIIGLSKAADITTRLSNPKAPFRSCGRGGDLHKQLAHHKWGDGTRENGHTRNDLAVNSGGELRRSTLPEPTRPVNSDGSPL